MKLVLGFAALVLALVAIDHFLLKSKDDESPPPPPVPAPHDPIPELLKLIDSGFKSGDWTGFDNACDLDVFVKTIIGPINVSEPLRECIAQTVKGGGPFGMKEKNGLRELLGKGGEWKLIKVRRLPEGARPVFRMALEDGSANYFEFVLGESWAARVRIVDVWFPLMGQRLSESIRRHTLSDPQRLMILNSLLAPTPGDLLKPEHFGLVELIGAGKAKEAEAFFVEHRRALTANKHAQLARLRNALTLGPDLSSKAFEEFEEQFPGDACLPVLRIRYLIERRRFEEALEAVNQVSADLEDSYWDTLRSKIHMDARRFDKAEALALKCIKTEPGLSEGWYALVAIDLRQQRYAFAADRLKEADKAAKIVPVRIEAMEGFQPFSETADYKSWIDSRRTR